MSYKIGLIGMIRDELQQDLWGTLKRMADWGYQGIEGGPFVSESPDEMAENRKRLADVGMELIALRCTHYDEAALDAAIRNAQALGARYLVDYWAGPETMEETLELAEQLERMAQRCRAEGIQMLYHNHEHEFQPRLGEKRDQCIFQVLWDHTEALNFELDVAWCHFGGDDPVAVLRRCGQRIPVLHIKDLSDDRIRGHFCAIGMGKVNCFGAMETAAVRGAEWMVVEQDSPGRLSHFDSALASILNIREAGLHPVLR